MPLLPRSKIGLSDGSMEVHHGESALPRHTAKRVGKPRTTIDAPGLVMASWLMLLGLVGVFFDVLVAHSTLLFQK